uniref:ARAD1D23540p n=1 Tax=Blastobotrys adeninivorans TaxID=409370 RepID=A0A060TA10_BLAAD
MPGHQYQFNVSMSCEGCSNAVNRALGRLEGVEKVDISLPTQTVDVKTADSVSYDTVLATIKKTGKAVNDGKVIA